MLDPATVRGAARHLVPRLQPTQSWQIPAHLVGLQELITSAGIRRWKSGDSTSVPPVARHFAVRTMAGYTVSPLEP